MSTPSAFDPESLLPLPTAVFHILVALADRDRHGYSIMQDVATRTDGKVRLSAGTLYSSIHRMLEQGLVDELHLLVHPIVVGHGKKLFTDGTTVPLKLLSSTTFTTGVLHLVYAGADNQEPDHSAGD